MGGSLFNIGLTGLNAARAGLVTTSHNILNAGTAGYSRQSTVQSTNPAMFTGSGFFGEGTRVDTVKRAQRLSEQSGAVGRHQVQQYDTYSTEISQIDNMLADTTVGLSRRCSPFLAACRKSPPTRRHPGPAVDDFHGPGLVAPEQSVPAPRRRALGIETQISDTVSTISTYAKDIADINNKIMIAQPGRLGPACQRSARPARSARPGTQQAGARIHQRR
jgi:flagellar hook-associated protein 1 FlgK